MSFYVNSGQEFSSESDCILLDEKTFFRDIRKILKNKLSILTRIIMKIVDDDHRLLIIHLKINSRLKQK